MAILSPTLQLLEASQKKSPKDDVTIIYDRDSQAIEPESHSMVPLITNASPNKKQTKKKPFKNIQDVEPKIPAPLKWIPLLKNGITCAELLVSAELIQLPADFKEPDEKTTATVGIPKEIYPTLTKYK